MNKTWVSAFGFIILMFTASAWTAPVPDTGQTKCYGVSGNVIVCPSPGQPLYGQDANFSINPVSYTKLDGSGNALPDSATSWSMVKDNITGLIWENKTDDGTIHDKDNVYTWYNPSDPYPGTPGVGTDSKDFIDALNIANFGGNNTWRLPTIMELSTIVSFNFPDPGPTINNKFFSDTNGSFYWSSTNFASGMDSAWGVYFSYGDNYSLNKGSFGSIRAVHSSRSESLGYSDYLPISPDAANVIDDHYIDNNDDTVTDTDSGLMWQQRSEVATSWEQALLYCNDLSLAGYTDWRLPTQKELQSIVDYSRYNPAINTTYFPDTFPYFYWSSTTYAFYTDYAWGVNYIYGIGSFNNKGGIYHVRAVRGGQSKAVGNSILFSNSIGPRNTIKISDMSGTLPTIGGMITISAWDENGKALSESGWAVPLKIYSRGTNIITGSDLAARFLNGTPILYRFSIDSSKVVITNVKNSTNDTFKVPIIYLNGMTNFVSNSIGNNNTIKISDISGLLPSSSTISVLAWDINGNSIPESGSAAPLKLFNHGTTSISGINLAARFPSESPMIYEFDVPSAKALITNVKNSTDGKLTIPDAYIFGVSKFVSNSIGNFNSLEISDLSGTTFFGGSAINIKAWDSEGNSILESGSAAPLKLFSHGTTSISGLNLAARFPTGIPITYEFSIESSKVLITNIKSSTDGIVEIPSIFSIGISNFTTNSVSSLNTIKISDTSGILPASGVSINITAWDDSGNVISESGMASASPLKLYNYGTTTIAGIDLKSRFAGSPSLYEFSIGSSSALVTSLTTSIDGTIKTPTIFTIGSYGGI